MNLPNFKNARDNREAQHMFGRAYRKILDDGLRIAKGDKDVRNEQELNEARRVRNSIIVPKLNALKEHYLNTRPWNSEFITANQYWKDLYPVQNSILDGLHLLTDEADRKEAARIAAASRPGPASGPSSEPGPGSEPPSEPAPPATPAQDTSQEDYIDMPSWLDDPE